MIQFNRVAQLVLAVPGLQQVVTLRTAFTIEKEMTSQGASKAEIKIYNMSALHVQFAQAVGQNLQITLSTGYSYDGQDNVSQLFTGLVNYVTNERQGPDQITIFEMLPGSIPLGNVFVSFAGVQSDWDIYLAVVNACKPFGISRGHLSAAVQSILQQKGVYQKGLSECGTAAKLMDLICNRHNLRWNSDSLNLSIFNPKEFETPTVVILSGPSAQYPNGTGLVGIPSKMQDGNYKIKALLNPDITPGAQILVTSVQAGLANQPFKVWKVTYTGDTLKGDWYVEAECTQPDGTPSLQVNSGT